MSFFSWTNLTFAKDSAANSIAYPCIRCGLETYNTAHAHLVEAILTAIADINYLDDFRRQSLIEHVTLTQLRLEVSASGKHEASDVNLVIRDKVLNGQLGDLSHVVVPLLVTQTGETQGRLSTTAVLLRQVDGEFVDHLTCVTGDSTEEGTITVHDDESEF